MPRVYPHTPEKNKRQDEFGRLGMWVDNQHHYTSFKEEPHLESKMFKQKLQLKHHRSVALDTRSDTQVELVFARFSNTYSTTDRKRWLACSCSHLKSSSIILNWPLDSGAMAVSFATAPLQTTVWIYSVWTLETTILYRLFLLSLVPRVLWLYLHHWVDNCRRK